METVNTQHMGNWRSGINGFSILVTGQGISLAGSAMASLAMSVWLWQTTGSATAMSLAGICFLLPQALLSPVAGHAVDTYGPRMSLVAASIGAAGASLAAIALVLLETLQPWQLFLLNGLTGSFAAIEVPAFADSMALLVHDTDRDRASGMLYLMQSAANVIAPALAGSLLALLELKGILVVDVFSFGIALASTFLVRIPVSESAVTSALPETPLRSLRSAGAIVRSHPLLVRLLALQVAMSVVGAVGMVFMAPLVLARSAGSAAAAGLVLGVSGAGGILGGLLMAMVGDRLSRKWGRMPVALTAIVLLSVFGLGLLGFARTTWMLAAAAFAVTFWLAFYSSPVLALWVSQIPHGAHGRVTALRQLLVRGAGPTAMLAAGPTADKLQLILTRQAAPAWLHGLLGDEAASGIGALFMLAALAGVAVAIVASLSSILRAGGGRYSAGHRLDHGFARDSSTYEEPSRTAVSPSVRK